jgi:hypothetical protein
MAWHGHFALIWKGLCHRDAGRIPKQVRIASKFSQKIISAHGGQTSKAARISRQLALGGAFRVMDGQKETAYGAFNRSERQKGDRKGTVK